MFIDFVLTEAPPDVNVNARTVSLGKLSDGIHITSDFPMQVSMNGYVELSFQREEHGVMEVVLVGEDLDRGDRRPLVNWILDVPPPEPGWDIPRKYPLSFTVPSVFEGEGDLALILYVDDKDLGEKIVSVRQLALG